MEEKAALKDLDSELVGDALAVANPKGLVVKSKINFAIEDPIVFCQAYPEFWAWHAETETLKLKRREILDELNKENGKGAFHKTRFPEELPDKKGSPLVKPVGMRVFEETRSHVR